MLRIILLALLLSCNAIPAAVADSCSGCHNNQEKMEALGYGGFAVNIREAEAQTRIPSGLIR
jgi:hypothetical protein